MSNQLFEHDYIHDSTVATILQYIIVGVSVFARPSTSIHLGLREFFFFFSLMKLEEMDEEFKVVQFSGLSTSLGTVSLFELSEQPLND